MADLNTSLMLPMLVQTLIICAWTFVLGGTRFVAAKSREVDLREVAKTRRWPGKHGIRSDSYDNQFQMPQLFYVACIALTLLGAVTPLAIKLAWAFVILRIVHMIWHNTKNVIIIRFLIFASAGIVVTWMLILALMAAL
ncbi:MAPEG family protein [Hellea sp.]|nr:MAPEG family protein [Hellea sp.]